MSPFFLAVIPRTGIWRDFSREVQEIWTPFLAAWSIRLTQRITRFVRARTWKRSPRFRSRHKASQMTTTRSALFWVRKSLAICSSLERGCRE